MSDYLGNSSNNKSQEAKSNQQNPYSVLDGE